MLNDLLKDSDPGNPQAINVIGALPCLTTSHEWFSLLLLQRGLETSPESHSWEVAESGPELSSFWLQGVDPAVILW